MSMTHRSHLWLHSVRAISYNSWSGLVFLQGKVNSSRYVSQVDKLILLPFLQEEGYVLFQQDNARPHTAALHVLRAVQQPWPAWSPDLSPIEHVWDRWCGNLLDLQSLLQPLPNCENRCKMLGTIYRRMTFGTLWPFACENTRRGSALCIDVTVWAPVTVTCVFRLVWIYYTFLQW